MASVKKEGAGARLSVMLRVDPREALSDDALAKLEACEFIVAVPAGEHLVSAVGAAFDAPWTEEDAAGFAAQVAKLKELEEKSRDPLQDARGMALSLLLARLAMGDPTAALALRGFMHTAPFRAPMIFGLKADPATGALQGRIDFHRKAGCSVQTALMAVQEVFENVQDAKAAPA